MKGSLSLGGKSFDHRLEILQVTLCRGQSRGQEAERGRHSTIITEEAPPPLVHIGQGFSL